MDINGRNGRQVERDHRASTKRLLQALQQEAVTTWADLVVAGGTSSEQSRAILSSHLRQLLNRGSISDRPEVERLVRVVQGELEIEPTVLLVESALFFDHVGDAERALVLACSGVSQATKIGNQNLLRKTLSIAGIAYSRVCDFENSCNYLERALLIARNLKDVTAEFAALCNIVAVLQVMGLLHEAKALAVKLSSYPSGTADLDFFHLQNCINGSKLARRTDDLSAAERFSALAQEMLNSINLVPTQWRVYVNTEEALLCIKKGDGKRARKLLMATYHEVSPQGNLRATVILGCARAACAIANSDVLEMRCSAEILIELIEPTATYPLHHEDVLRALVDLSSHYNSPIGKDERVRFQTLLNAHVINTKHRQFFARLGGAKVQLDLTKVHISLPYYELPPSIAKAAFDGAKGLYFKGESCLVSRFDQVDLPIESALPSARAVIEKRHRTANYSRALDWAVAADFGTERAGQHCLQVGLVVGLIAEHLGFSKLDSVRVEMASRLHDIGKLFVDSTVQRAVNHCEVDDFSVVQRHTLAGSLLLSSINEPIFKLASQVALQHHESWNGCGFPHALTGQNICIEARICAVADLFVKLCNAAASHTAWSEELAARQTAAMSGTQLDPAIVNCLLELVEKRAFSEAMNFSRLNVTPNGDMTGDRNVLHVGTVSPCAS